MSITTSRVQMIRAAVEAAGAKLPKPVAKAMADRDKLATATADIPGTTAEQVQDAVADAILDGRDPLDDEQVRRLATSRALTGTNGQSIAYGVPLAGERRIVKAVRDHSDEILHALREAAARHGQTLADAHRLIGDHDLSESELILRLGPDAARAWADARDAVAKLRTIEKAWQMLATLTGFASDATGATLRLADLDLDTFEQVGRKADAWGIVRAGGTIDLADATSIVERTQRHEQERAARQQQPTDAFRQGYRRVHGVNVA